MTIEFSCGNCGKQLKTNDSRAGQRGKCPDCGEPILVPSPALMGDEFETEEYDLPPAPMQSTTSGSIICPMCGARVSASAKSCSSCGEALVAETATRGEFSTGHKLRSDEVFSQAWQAYKSQMGLAIGGIVVWSVCALANNLLSGAMQSAAGLEFDRIGRPVFVPGQSSLALFLLSMIVPGVIGVWLQLGVIRFTVSIARGEKGDISLLFSGTPYFIKAVLATIVLGLVVGAVALIVGLLSGLLGTLIGPAAVLIVIPLAVVILIRVILSLFWFQYLIVDQNLGPMKSLEVSRSLMPGNYFTLFALLLFAGILVALGVLMLGIGVFFTLPLSMILLSAAYDQITGGGTRRPG